jgi:heme oxygenase
MTVSPPNIQITPLSSRLRDRTADVHEAAERSAFITQLLDGALPIDAYVDLLVQYRAVYGALETASEHHQGHEVVGLFADPALHRRAAIEDDLRVLGGEGWSERHTTTPATDEYTARIHEVCTGWPGGFVAHHYVRYLGDLSGGQLIRRVLGRHYGITDGVGLSFYVFDRLDNGVEFKKAYRARLDEAPWDDAEQTRVVEEARRAFEHNIALFTSLDRPTRVS